MGMLAGCQEAVAVALDAAVAVSIVHNTLCRILAHLWNVQRLFLSFWMYAMCMSLFPTYVYIISSYSCRYFTALYSCTLFIEHISLSNLRLNACAVHVRIHSGGTMCIDVQIKSAANVNYQKFI